MSDKIINNQTTKKERQKIRMPKPVKVPTVIQMESVECGAASLAMILAYYGKYVTLEELRVDCGVSRDGSKASNMLKAARSYGLDAKGFRKEPKDLETMKCPVIIHWNFNHFVVLEGFKKDKVYLRDPGSGERIVTKEEFDQSFTGIVMTFSPSADFKKSGKKPSIVKALLSRMKGNEIALLFATLVGLALVIPGLVLPVFMKVFLDKIIMAKSANWLMPLIIGMGITAIIRGILTWLQGNFLLKFQNKISLASSGKFLWHILRLPMQFFTQRSAGDINSRMSSNDTVAGVLSGKLATTALSAVMIVFYFILMLQYDVLLTLFGVFIAVFNVLYLGFVAKTRVDKNKKLQQDAGKMIGTSMGGLQIIETLKATGSEADFFSRWSGYYAKVLNAKQEMGVINSYMMTVPGFVSTAINVIILVVGGLRIMNGTMTVGALVAFQSLMQSFLAPVGTLMDMGSTIQELKGDIDRLDDILKHPQDPSLNVVVSDTNEFRNQKQKLDGYVEIKDLKFGYSILEPPLIENFNLSLKPGFRVALVGSSGSGKSTIAKLISGLYKPWSGDITFDGAKMENIPREVLNNSLSVVNQEISMFGDTIKNNITLWDDIALDADIVQASKDAFIHDDITARVGGYENMLDEGGVNFSGGQRQRLEIARALINNPSILILDEATSALDPNTEQQIDENIRRRGCTCIIVAHRLSTIRDCDEIIVLDKGKIVQRGTHDQLKSVDGHYQTLISLQ